MGKTKDILLKVGVEISRILLGITFIFSGFVKSTDPLGTVYKIQDYLTSFGLVQFHDLAFIATIVLCATEFCLGMFMLLGLYRKWTSRVLFLVMIFMTILTLYIAIENPVKDCGCFGDALIITNWQTFYKNIILLACSILTLIYHQKISNIFTGKFYWLSSLYIVLYSLLFCVYNYYYDPIIDFRPYKIGNSIPEQMTVDEDKAPIYENVMIYEKDGVKKEFSENNYPWEDSTWVFVDREDRLIKEGIEPAIAEFSINRLYLSPDKTEVEGSEDITQEILTDKSYTFLMIAYSLENMHETYLSRFEDINNYAKEKGYKFYCLTASPEGEIIQLERDNITNFVFCTADSRVLKTMIRSNPGLILLKDGVVINKWVDRLVPDEARLSQNEGAFDVTKMPNREDETNKNLLFAISILVIPLFATKIFDALLYHRKSIKSNENLQDNKNP